MSKIFMDTEKAAAFMGLSRRHFVRKFVETDKIEIMRMNPSRSEIAKGDRKHFFLVKDLEALKHETGGDPSSG